MSGGQERLLVPIAVRAMLCGAIDAERKFYPQTLDYTKLRLNPTGSLVPTAYISRQENIERGIHLHWFLPNALTRGEMQEESGEIVFPPIPNRWRVYRLWHSLQDLTSSVKMRCFEVESDALAMNSSAKIGNAGSPTVPYDGAGMQKHQFLGRAYPLDKRPAGEMAYLDELTAVSAGNPYYTAYYPDCRNVLGFYDDMTDEQGEPVTDAHVTYVVTGWYRQDDPLTAVIKYADYEQQWKWRVPETFLPGGGMVCHGLIDGLKWEDARTSYPQAIPVKDARIAVGNNTEEALAALLSVLLPERSAAERMMQHLLAQNCQALQEANGVLKSENRLMQNRFGKRADAERLAAKPSTLNEEVPLQMQKLLDLASIEIGRMNAARRELTKLRQCVYDAWYRYTQAAYAARVTPATAKTMQECKEKIETLAPQVEAQKAVYREALSRKEARIKELAPLSGNKFRVSEQGGQRFWKPNNPLLLFADMGADTVRDEDGAKYADGMLICRVTSDVQTALVITCNEHGAMSEVCVSGEEVLPSMVDMDEQTRSILCEAVLLSSSFFKVLADRAAAKSTGKSIDDWKEMVQAAQKSSRKGFAERFIPPWNPLFMSWQAAFYPDPEVGRSVPDLKNWKLENNEYSYCGPKIKNDGGVILRGFDLLTPHASEIAGSAALEQLGYRMPKIETVAQELADFHDQFGMVSPGLVMPVRDRVKNPALAEYVSALLEKDSPVSGNTIPSFDGYYAPVRAGYLVFAYIHMIDSFGQIKVIEDPSLIVSEHMRDGGEPVRRQIMLPPRILQEARIQVDWWRNDVLPAVCGWLIPNMLEGTIDVYDSEGVMLGSLVQSAIEESVVGWRSTPGEGGARCGIPEEIHPDLYGFLCGITAGWKERRENLLAPLLRVIDRAMATINPADAKQFDGLGMFLGRPLVLVKATVAFELFEPQHEAKYPVGKEPAEIPKLEKSRFPVWIGQRQNQNDGVIGFYEGEDYDTLHLSAVYDDPLPGYFSADHKITLPVSYPPQARDVTLLMDPAGEVNFISGLLPVKTKKLKRQLVDESIRKLQYNFFLAPVLTGQDEMTLPYPVIPAADWSFSGYPLDMRREAVLEEITELRRTNGEAAFLQSRLCAREGWMHLTKEEVQNEE